MEQFQPNANNILDVLYNKKPKYLPLYEHHIDIEFMEKNLSVTKKQNQNTFSKK